MVKRHKRRKFSGRVCEQIVYKVAGGTDPKTSRPKKPRFQSQEEREEFNTRISAAKFAALVNANFGPTSYYSTLTLDQEHEVHTAQEMRRIRDNFYRRMVYRYPEAKIVIVYGRGKSTNRFHLHLITDGIPADELGRLWGLGSVIDCKPLRKHNYYLDENGNKIDHGQDYTGLANYLFDHWTPEQGGHRWKQTKNARRPDIENAKPVRRAYSESRPPAAPKGYILVETRGNAFGYLYYKYIKCPDKPETNKNENRKS